MDRETTDRQGDAPATGAEQPRTAARTDADARDSHAVPQDGSTKVHGDKLEEQIPREGPAAGGATGQGDGSTAGP